ncbi:hypothetical protein ACFTWS_34745 [Streptomyces sp. NPDC057027]|uniref:hypothetical protein n=1 Tax=unclassified Streptomyces TaxID=2593676 RepID=UPI0035D60FFD
MLEHTKRVAGVDRGGDRPWGLPDLTGVDLRTLRFMDDPALVAAVDRVLWHPQELGASWFVEGSGDKADG